MAFSFGLRAGDEEPNPSNLALGHKVVEATEQAPGTTVIVAQWEIARHLERQHLPLAGVVTPGEGYLDSTAVWADARAVLRAQGVSDVMAVAHPWLHLGYVQRMIRADGFTVVGQPPGPVPFDTSERNTQWWTRSRHGMVLYGLGKQWPWLRPLLARCAGPWPQ